LYSVVRSLAAEGLAVLLITSVLIEVIGLADRIVVLHDGRVAGELPAGATEQQVMAYATGRSPSSACADPTPPPSYTLPYPPSQPSAAYPSYRPERTRPPHPS